MYLLANQLIFAEMSILKYFRYSKRAIFMDYKQKLSGCRYLTDELRKSKCEKEEDILQECERDRGKIVQSSAVRRLQQKTQVYPLEPNAAVRSRLTHSLEVQQTGRLIARKILNALDRENKLEIVGLSGLENIFVSFVEMACIIHDVGNPPFGHFGEAVLSNWLKKNIDSCFNKSLGGANPSLFFQKTLVPDLSHFEGNAQGLRILHTLQGLNLTYTQLASTIKYTRAAFEKELFPKEPLSYFFRKPGYFYSEKTLVSEISDQLHMNAKHRHPLVYIMEAADDISYCIADLEDALDKGIFTVTSLCERLREEWQSQAGDSCYLTDLIKNATLGDSNNNYEFMRVFRLQLAEDMAEHAARRYLNFHELVFDGSFNEPLIEGRSEQYLALITLKEVARKFVFMTKEVELPELRGYSAFMGLLDIYRPFLEMPGDEFLSLLDLGYSENYFIQQRLVHRLPPRHVKAYRKAVLEIDTVEFSESELELEWYYRCRLFIDYFSGMTDNFVLQAFQRLSAI